MQGGQGLPPPPLAPLPPGNELSLDQAQGPTVFPFVYVSPAGLLTVLMRQDVAVEMTLDRAIRVVNHLHRSVAATNARGNSSCLYHQAAKVPTLLVFMWRGAFAILQFI